MHLLGTLILFLIFLIFTLFSKRVLLVSGIASGVLTLIAIVNHYEIILHGTVLTLLEIKNIPTALNALKNYSIQLSPAVAKMLFFLSVLLFILTFIYTKGLSFKSDKIAGSLTVASLIILLYVVFFSPFNIVNSLDMWSWEIRYYVDSCPVGVFENISKSMMGITKPEGYNTAEIEDVQGTSGINSDYPDIIMILNETYFDLDHVIDFNTDVSYKKNYDSLDAYKGYAAVPMIGGGTNASEYELITSNSTNLLNTVTPFNELNLKNSCSIVDYLKKLGYSTMAATSEPAGNYHRGNAWTDLGFEAVHFFPDFKDLEYYESRYSASDSSLFKNFKQFYEEMPEEQPRFAYLLTIQNHGGWDRNTPDKDTVHIRDDHGLSGYEQQINEYLTCVQQTDDFIGEVVEYFSKAGRPVIVYMVGDHGPSLLKEWDLGNSDELNLKKRQTPFFIWSNQGFDKDNLPANSNIDLCSLTPVALKAAGLPLSPYYTTLVRLADDVQCITGTVASGADNGDEAENIQRYFFMEYNRLQRKDQIDKLNDPWMEP